LKIEQSLRQYVEVWEIIWGEHLALDDGKVDLYAQVVRDSRKQWQVEHAAYQKTYWQTHPEAAERTARDSASGIGNAASPIL
jgi:hypothetical protein